MDVRPILGSQLPFPSPESHALALALGVRVDYNHRGAPDLKGAGQVYGYRRFPRAALRMDQADSAHGRVGR